MHPVDGPFLSVLMTISMVIRMSQNYSLLPSVCNYKYLISSAQSFCNRGGMTEYRCCFASLRTFQFLLLSLYSFNSSASSVVWKSPPEIFELLYTTENAFIFKYSVGG